MKTTLPNTKRSRFVKKTNEELLFEILVLVERAGSFCPEKLMCKQHRRIFEEVYRRFDTWNEIVEQCVHFSNKQDIMGTILKTPKDVILEVLRLESGRQSLQEADILAIQPELHSAAVLFYGSWDRVLAVVGLKRGGNDADVTK